MVTSSNPAWSSWATGSLRFSRRYSWSDRPWFFIPSKTRGTSFSPWFQSPSPSLWSSRCSRLRVEPRFLSLWLGMRSSPSFSSQKISWWETWPTPQLRGRRGRVRWKRLLMGWLRSGVGLRPIPYSATCVISGWTAAHRTWDLHCQPEWVATGNWEWMNCVLLQVDQYVELCQCASCSVLQSTPILSWIPSHNLIGWKEWGNCSYMQWKNRKWVSK